jgi:hypothetical protein
MHYTMHYTMHYKIIALMSCCLMALAPQLASAFAIRAVAPGTSVVLGETAQVEVVVSGLAPNGAPALSSFDFNVRFDTSVLGIDINDGDGDGVIDSIALDPSGQLDLFASGLNPVAATLTGIGELNLFELSFDLPADLNALQPGTFILATIQFQTIGAGTAAIVLESNTMVDAFGDRLVATVQGDHVVVVTRGVPLPLPPTTALMALGVLAALARRRRS